MHSEQAQTFALMSLRQTPELSFCAPRSVRTSRIDFWRREALGWTIRRQNGTPESPKSRPKIQGLSSSIWFLCFISNSPPIASAIRVLVSVKWVKKITTDDFGLHTRGLPAPVCQLKTNWISKILQWLFSKKQPFRRCHKLKSMEVQWFNFAAIGRLFFSDNSIILRSNFWSF